MVYEFDIEIKTLEGKIKWSVLYFPHPAEECFGMKGNIPVKITADGHAFDHTLLPSRNGHYLVYNEFLKRAVNKKSGEIVHVTLEKDDTKREFKLSEGIEAALAEAGVLNKFMNQPDYYKREQANHIELAKKDETRANRIGALIQRLKG